MRSRLCPCLTSRFTETIQFQHEPVGRANLYDICTCPAIFSREREFSPSEFVFGGKIRE